MPNQNDPNQTNPNTSNQTSGDTSVTPVFSPSSDLPPLPPDFTSANDQSPASTAPDQPTTPEAPSESGSASPPPEIPPVITPSHKKKFGGGRIIATILGLFLLIGGIAGGVILTQQQQDIREMASTSYCSALGGSTGNCPSGQTCSCPEWTYDWENPGPQPDCECVNVVQGQENCYHTICPVGYSCVGTGWESYCVNSGGSTPPPGTPPPGTSTPPPGTPPPGTPPGPTASCQNIKAYNTSWTQITAQQLPTLTVGTTINFCVTGVASAESFNKARFTINGVLRPETTTKRPASDDYCQAFTIPAGVTTFNVGAEIHHTSLGWK